jgi:hypothetical protein
MRWHDETAGPVPCSTRHSKVRWNNLAALVEGGMHGPRTAPDHIQRTNFKILYRYWLVVSDGPFIGHYLSLSLLTSQGQFSVIPDPEKDLQRWWQVPFYLH